MADTNFDKLATDLKWRDYYSALGKIRDVLGLPINTSHAEMEALLIFAINDIYPESIKADVALMALGLLSGFSCERKASDSKGERKLYQLRCNDFIQFTDYLSRTGNDNKPLKTIQSTLNTNTGRFIADVLLELYERQSKEPKQSISDYLDAAKKSFEERVHKKINWKSCKHIPNELHPPLKYLNRISSVSPTSGPIPAPSIDTEGGMGKNPTGGPEPPPPEPPTPEPKSKFSQMLFLFTFLIPIFVFCAPIIHQYAISINILPQLNVNAVSYSDREIFPSSKDFDISTVEEVKITNPDLVITQGCMTPLEVEITPAEAVDSDLYYSTSNIHAVVVSPSGWVIALKSYQSQEPSITAQVAVSSLNGKSDETSVTVLYPDAFPSSIWSDLEGD